MNLDTYVRKNYSDFIDLYIRTSSYPELFLDAWARHCEKTGIGCTGDQIEALIEKAEDEGEIEEGDIFVGEWWDIPKSRNNPRRRKNPTYLITLDEGKGDGEMHYLVEDAKNATEAKKTFLAERFRPLGRNATIKASLYKSNPRRQDDFIQTAFDEIEKDGTEGSFTRYVANNFYGKNTPQKRKAVAQKIKSDYEKWVKKGKKGKAPFALTTYRRATFYLNIQKN